VQERKKLTDILQNGNGGNKGDNWINKGWDEIPPAPDFGTPVPRGCYIAHVINGELFNAATGTPGFKLSFEIIEGEHRGRRLWYDIWLTDAAKAGAVRDLAKLGIHDKQQLERPIPPRRIRCKILAVVRKDDDGIERNAVKTYDVIDIDPEEANPFAPKSGPDPLDGSKQGEAAVSSSRRSGPKEPFPPGLPDNPPRSRKRKRR
jgi:hypothetical protein